METKEPRINWYRTSIDRDELKRLTTKSDAKGLVQAVSFMLVWAITLGLALWCFINHWWVAMVVAAYVHATFLNFMGMEAAVHELSHGTAFKTPKLNEFFYRLFSFLTWNNWQHFRLSHTKHHHFTVHKGLDKEVVIEAAPFGSIDFISWFTFDFKKFGHFFRVNLAHVLGKADVDFFYWDPLLPADDPKRKTIVAWARFMMLGHLVLLGLFVWFQLWILIVLVNFGYFFATFLAKSCGVQQHAGLQSDVDDWRVSCHSVRFGPLMSWLYWNMNWHIEHHMYAAVPFHAVGKLHLAIARDTPLPVKGWGRGLSRIFAIWKKQKADPGYCFVPELPGK